MTGGRSTVQETKEGEWLDWQTFQYMQELITAMDISHCTSAMALK